MKHRYVALLAGAALTIVKEPATGQTLARRIDGSAAAAVQFHFASRPPICGDGRAYMRVSSDGWISGSWDSMRSLPCERGPVRVVLVRAGGETIRIETFAGPLAVDSTAADLGAGGSAEAAAYLMSIATGGEGRVARDALTGAALADSADISKGLMAIARDQSRARETRSSAINWLSRASDERGGVPPAQLAKALGDMARDENDNQQVRQSALRVLSRQENGEGIPALIEISRTTQDVWLGKQALSTLAQSGDPRARTYLRSAVQRDDLNDEMRVAAIRGIGHDYATSQDAEFLRGLYAKLPSEKTKEAVLSSLGEMGGTANAKWLMTIAANNDESVRLRRRAVQLSERAGTSIADLAQLYDRVDDPQMKDAIIATLSNNGTKAALDKLLAIAKNDPNYSMRRRAVSALGRSEDPRVKDALKDIVEK